MSTARRFLGVGAVLGLAAGLLVGVGLTQPGRAAAATPSTALSLPSGVAAAGAPRALPGAIHPSSSDSIKPGRWVRKRSAILAAPLP
jgi:hypothetical protein